MMRVFGDCGRSVLCDFRRMQRIPNIDDVVVIYPLDPDFLVVNPFLRLRLRGVVVILLVGISWASRLS